MIRNGTEQFFHETGPYGRCMYEAGGKLRQLSVRFLFNSVVSVLTLCDVVFVFVYCVLTCLG